MNDQVYSMLHNEAVKFALNNLQSIPNKQEVESVVKGLNIEFFCQIWNPIYGLHFTTFSKRL
jgi:hypothetical protein